MSNNERIVAIEEHFISPTMANEYTGHHKLSALCIPREGLKTSETLESARWTKPVSTSRSFHTCNPDLRFSRRTCRSPWRARPTTSFTKGFSVRPDRFAGFAALPTPNPEAAADELERTVTELGFKGALISGLTNGSFLDDKKFWPIFERAAKLDVPIYLHPAIPNQMVVEAYYDGYRNNDYPILMGAVWGFTVETATHALRLILSGVFQEYPRLKIILGHLGETLPFLLWRLEWTYNNLTNKAGIAKCFREHFYVTTSGNFSQPALLCTVMELGADRILFAVDWPFNSNIEGVEFVRTASIKSKDKSKIFAGNAARLLRV